MIVAALRLLVLAAGVGDPLGPTDQDPDAVREDACKLVESSDVCSPPKPPRLDTSTGGSGGAVGGLLNLLLWGLLIAVLLGIGFVAYRYFAERVGDRSTSDDGEDEADPDGEGRIGAVVVDRSREPRAWREEADAHRAAGRFRDALRCRYRALVGDLARRGLLDEIPGRTTGEERRQLRANAPDAVPFFREAADLFDGAWYGHVAVGAGDDDRFRELEQQVLR